ncbi:MAG: quinol:cytochrome C oxidoreductase [bacterium]
MQEVTFKEEDIHIKTAFVAKVSGACMKIGLISLLLSFVLFFVDRHHFFYSYLTVFSFFMTLTLGSLFFVMILHVTRAGWGIVVRRIAECLMNNIGLMFLLFLPLLFGIHDLYHWSHADAVAHDHLLQVKFPYLNVPFFIIRALVFFLIWFFLAKRFYQTSIKQDQNGDSSLTLLMQKTATYGLLLYAITQSFAFIDWVMSLTPHWYSTIFGVYFFAGSTMVALTVITLILMILRRNGYLRDLVTIEHYHDLGKLSYGFMIFWSYIAFCQFFLIWYSNIPEETLFYKQHFEGTWRYVMILLCVGHFGIPFLGFMSRHVKRNLFTHCLMACWLVFMHYVDMYWIIMPGMFPDGINYSLFDIVLLLGFGGIYFSVFFKRLTYSSLIPVKDPRIQESLAFKNY